MPTPDRRAGPLLEEEIQLEDRGPGGEDPGAPTVTGAIRRINDKLHYKEAAAVAQVLKARNFPVGFDDVDLTGLSDGKVLSYDGPNKRFVALENLSEIDDVLVDDVTLEPLVDDVIGNLLVDA